MASMTKMRVVADNAAERATVTASSTAGALAATNLQNAKKSMVWRATGATATLALTWPSPETLSMLALFGNFSPSDTIRVRGYSDSAGNNQVLDTGVQLACPAPAVQLRGWPAAKSASAYANGGGAMARIWFTETTVQRLMVDLVDTGNLQGYLEAAYLVTGRYWAPAYTATEGTMTPVDTTALDRNGAGDQTANAGCTYRQLEVDLGKLAPADRTAFVNILRNSRTFPILVSLFAGSPDLALERDHMIYGRRPEDSKIALAYAEKYSTSVTIEEV